MTLNKSTPNPNNRIPPQTLVVIYSMANPIFPDDTNIITSNVNVEKVVNAPNPPEIMSSFMGNEI